MAEDDAQSKFVRFSKFPQDVAHLARGIQQVSDDLLQKDAGSLLTDTAINWPGMATIGKTRFDMRAYLIKKNKTAFFGFKKKGKRVLMDLGVSFAIHPGISGGRDSAPSIESLLFNTVIPFFIWVKPDESDLQQFAPQGADGENSLLLRLGSSGKTVLGVKIEDNEIRRIKFTTAGSEEQELDDSDVWPVEIFLTLVETLRAWMEQEAPDGESYTFNLAAQENEKGKLPFQIIRNLAKAYCNGVTTLELPAAKPKFGKALESLRASYKFKNYKSSLNLALTKTGFLAENADKKDTFQLRLNTVVIEKELFDEFLISVGIADFLNPGEFHQRFIEQIIEYINDRLLEFDGPSPPAEHFQNERMILNSVLPVVQSHGEEASIIRTERGGRLDTDMIVIQAESNAGARLVVLSAKFEVDTLAKPPGVILREPAAFRVLYDGIIVENSKPFTDTTGYLEKLLLALRNWIGILPI